MVNNQIISFFFFPIQLSVAVMKSQISFNRGGRANYKPYNKGLGTVEEDL